LRLPCIYIHAVGSVSSFHLNYSFNPRHQVTFLFCFTLFWFTGLAYLFFVYSKPFVAICKYAIKTMSTAVILHRRKLTRSRTYSVREGQTPLQVAVQRSHSPGFITALLEAGADVNAVGDPHAIWWHYLKRGDTNDTNDGPRHSLALNGIVARLCGSLRGSSERMITSRTFLNCYGNRQGLDLRCGVLILSNV
jgi:hypothetical protein